jgi:hypothetical protein
MEVKAGEGKLSWPVATEEILIYTSSNWINTLRLKMEKMYLYIYTYTKYPLTSMRPQKNEILPIETWNIKCNFLPLNIKNMLKLW